MAGSAQISTPFTTSLVNGTLKQQHYQSKGLPVPTNPAPSTKMAGPSYSPVASFGPLPPPKPAPTQNNNQTQNVAPVVDPWASTPWGSQAAYNKAVGDYNAAKTTTYGSIKDATDQAGMNFKGSILDYLDAYKAQQGEIDSSAVQNELARRQGTRGVLDMVGTGLRSGGVALNNANATNSSAAEAIARAYGELGRREQTGVNNQYEMGNEQISQAQAKLAALNETQKRHFSEDKVRTVNSIVSDASNQLSALNQAAANASLEDRVNIEAEKARIRQETLDALSQYDALLTQLAQPSSTTDNRKKAAQLDTAGLVPEGDFNYSTAIPPQYQGSGPFASTLPIFTIQR